MDVLDSIMMSSLFNDLIDKVISGIIIDRS